MGSRSSPTPIASRKPQPTMSAPDAPAPEKLIYMANQIGAFFKAQDTEKASAKIAEHLLKFWDPRMRRAIVAHLDTGGSGLDAPVRAAVESLRDTAKPK